MTSQRIGILGGTFDPVHNGHIQLAESALRECLLDKVVLLPAAQPPHKEQSDLTDFMHRLAMLKIVCLENKKISCDDIEVKLPTPSYTIDTLKVLSKNYGSDTLLFFIVGGDSFLDFLTWKAHKNILKLVNVVIAQRRGYQKERLADFLYELGYTKTKQRWRGCCGMKEVFFLRSVPGDFSSSKIRKKFKKNEIPRHYLPEKVIDYIQSHKLYSANVIDSSVVCSPEMCLK